MKVYLYCLWMMALGSFVILTSCQGKNLELESVETSATDTAELSQANPKTATTTSQCENGQTPKILSGDCSGVWSVKKTEDGQSCEFAWKPTVTCPTGMKPIGLQSACYGVTIRPANTNTKTTEDCVAAHGKYPISPAYKLECCP